MFHLEAGAGEPLVLIMGFGGDHLGWGFQVPAFAERHRVIVFDNRGAGQTDSPDAPWTIATMAEDTVGLLDALGVEQAHVCGVSMGGMIAQEIALNHPARVLTLQLHCTAARTDAYTHARGEAWEVIRTKLTREEASRAIFPALFAPGSYNERGDFVEMLLARGLANPYPQSLAGFRRQREAIAAHDTRDRLGLIRCPTLVSVGEEDTLLPPRFAREVASRIPGAEFRVLPGGHVYFWEFFAEFNAMCLEFLARHTKK
jgi:pimeloyl-ACP methyl ester carboxylesterase